MKSLDGTNCFDRMSHPFASLVCHPVGLHTEQCLSIQSIKMHLKIGHGMSDSFYAGTDVKTFQVTT